MRFLGGTVLGLRPGDLATWAAAVIAGISLVLLALGSLHDRRQMRIQRAEDAWLDKSQQARMVGAWLEPGGQPDSWRMSVRNASQLPVRQVKGYLVSNLAPPRTFLTIDVVAPGALEITTLAGVSELVVTLLLAYTDDSGCRWRKYGVNEGLAALGPGDPDISPAD